MMNCTQRTMGREEETSRERGGVPAQGGEAVMEREIKREEKGEKWLVERG